MNEDIPSEQPPKDYVRRSDYHCECGVCCLTDGTGIHWCPNEKCKFHQVEHPNILG